MTTTINASTASGLVVTPDNSGQIAFQNNGTTELTVNAFGIGLGSAVPSSGTGITFPATQSASSDANTLDDYEEGTWTPVITNGTTNVTSYYWQLGYYVKIGKNVFISMQISVNVVGSISGNIRIDGLPFAAANPVGYNIYTLFGSKYSPTTGAVAYLIDTGTNRLVPSFTSSYPTQLTSSDLGSGGQWSVQGWYLVAN
jgi:hypothetical protein